MPFIDRWIVLLGHIAVDKEICGDGDGGDTKQN